MIRSMTGFGAAEGPLEEGSRVSVELRSVNHRFFNPSLKLPASLSRWEGEVREALRRRISRGHVTLMARIERGEDGAAAVDETRFAAHVERLRALRDRYGLAGEVDLATVLRMPDVFASGSEPASPHSPTGLLRVVDAAATALTDMRRLEGDRLAEYLVDRLAVLERSLDAVSDRAPVRLAEHRERLRQSVRELLNGVAVDEQRVAQEIAILADRMDVQEELLRFRAHMAAFRDALEGPEGEGVGKRLGFLLQEMLREANTIGSKANDAVILLEVVSIKEELERIREQVENVE